MSRSPGPGVPALIGSLIGTILPCLGLLAAIILFWGTRFSWLNPSMLLGSYLLTILGVWHPPSASLPSATAPQTRAIPRV